jgi:LmbE family N-acetylglucosaminyl deacetylase
VKVLVLSPHTDDAELGCGGSIIKFSEDGDEIFWVVFSSAEESLPSGLPGDTLKNEYLQVMEEIGLTPDNYKLFDYKVRNLPMKRQEILEELIHIRKDFLPDIVLGPSLNDFHQDHQVVANEMIRAFKTNASILCYELPWNHVSFDTQLFIKLKKEHLTKKCRILKKYRSQIITGKKYFSREFIFGLAKTRGIQCNSEYAESFEVIRWII